MKKVATNKLGDTRFTIRFLWLPFKPAYPLAKTKWLTWIAVKQMYTHRGWEDVEYIR